MNECMHARTDEPGKEPSRVCVPRRESLVISTRVHMCLRTCSSVHGRVVETQHDHAYRIVSLVHSVINKIHDHARVHAREHARVLSSVIVTKARPYS